MPFPCFHLLEGRFSVVPKKTKLSLPSCFWIIFTSEGKPEAQPHCWTQENCQMELHRKKESQI